MNTFLLKMGGLLTCLLLAFVVAAQDVTVTVNPANSNQQVTFGGDGKLTIKDWAEKNVTTTAQKLYGDMDLKVLRVPIFALQPITDPIYDNVITVIQEVQAVNSNVKVFASVANGDGYGTDYHGAEKFPASMRGCCPYNVYDLNLTAYAAYLDSFMDRMSAAGITVDYLGPWNEDPADDSDHRKVFDQMTKLGGTQKIGLERWGLLTSVADVNDVEDRVDIIGSHFYDDATINDWDATWSNLVSQSADPVWYTEATRYSTGDNVDLLIAGMDNIFPSIRAGAQAVIFYQVVKRFVYANGNELPIKYTGFKNLVNNSENKNYVTTSSSNTNVSAVAFSNGNRLSIHLINKNSSNKSTKIQLQNGYKASGLVTRTIWDSSNTEVSNSYTLGNNASWTITMPANSYVHLDVPLSSSGARVASNLSEENMEMNRSFRLVNPVRDGELSLTLPASQEDYSISIYHLNGSLLSTLKTGAGDQTLNIAHLTRGTYLLSIINGEYKMTRKLILP